ncbi:MAG: DUF3025 domain-containing protein [Burkholderiales bacterium]|nr:DUF3025 domain-containing protein [Burkholderiales bacterium]
MDGAPHFVKPDAVDWAAPWFGPWREGGERIALASAQGVALHDALNREPQPAVRFVAATELPAGMAYERFIFDTGQCPTREGLHDFFNGLAWLRFPLAKGRLNEIQAAQIAAQGIAGERGPVRDAATLFDENGALLDAPPPVWEALLAHDWPRLFITLRPLWKNTRLLVFGHALLEKLVSPRKGLTAHVWSAQAAIESIADADRWLAAQLSPQALAAKPFTALPLLGVPGWWPENEDPAFYDDARIFRQRKGS